MYITTCITFNLSTNLEVKQQQSCMRFKLRTSENVPRREFGIFARPVGVELLKFCSIATRLHSPTYTRRCTLLRPVYESSFWTSKEVYETSSQSAYSR